VSVVVMAYNEVGGLERVVRELRAALDGLARLAEIVIVDDGSTDGTSALADRLAREIPGTRVVHHAPNQGLGGVYRSGFAEARQDLLTFFPADGQFSPEILTRFVPLMADHDLVLGYLPEGRKGVVGVLLSAFERVLYRALFGVLPRFQGIFMIRRQALRRLTLVSDGRGWAIVMEMIVRAVRAGLRIRSEPTALRPRTAGVSKVQNVRTIWSNLRQVVELRGRL
jgi:dolichol-phosphate mannosyltransferase